MISDLRIQNLDPVEHVRKQCLAAVASDSMRTCGGRWRQADIRARCSKARWGGGRRCRSHAYPHAPATGHVHILQTQGLEHSNRQPHLRFTLEDRSERRVVRISIRNGLGILLTLYMIAPASVNLLTTRRLICNCDEYRIRAWPYKYTESLFKGQRGAYALIRHYMRWMRLLLRRPWRKYMI